VTVLGVIDLACLCSLDDNENIVVYNAMCPLHKHLATPAKTLTQRWCSGSSEGVVESLSARTGRCVACRLEVPAKYGITGVHLPDGTTPRG
jgi:hypothetical protein